MIGEEWQAKESNSCRRSKKSKGEKESEAGSGRKNDIKAKARDERYAEGRNERSKKDDTR